MVAIMTRKPPSSGKPKYKRLAKARVSKSRNIVVSMCSTGGFKLAQQLVVEDEGSETTVFLKGAYFIKDLDSLIDLRDAIDNAIDEVIKQEEQDVDIDAIEWDE